jgi:hypothetical protein
MANYATTNKSCPLLSGMLRTICWLYPNNLNELLTRINKNGTIITEQSAVPFFNIISRVGPSPNSNPNAPNLYVRAERQRSTRGKVDGLLPHRFVFTGPFLQITYEGAHKTLQGRDIAGRIIYEFYDGINHRLTKEMARFIFTYEGTNKDCTGVRVTTTRAFNAFETRSLSDFHDLQPFLFVLMQNEKLAQFLKLVINDVDREFRSKDERPRSLHLLEAVFNTPAPAFDPTQPRL